jgi:PST family polysaccharide transporter
VLTLARNTLWLGVSQAAGLAAPLVMVPFLARALRPEGWAPVLAAQALAAWLTLILDYAADLSGSRDVARARQSGSAPAEVVRGMQSARLLLVPVAASLAWMAWVAVPVLRGQGALVASALALAVCRGLNPFWYFQGVERVRLAALVDAATRMAAAVSVVMVVRDASRAWLVLGVQAAFAALSLVWLTAAMAREFPLLAPSWRAALQVLRATGTIFGIRAVGGVYTQASTVLLGMTAAPPVVAAYGAAERIVRAAVSVLQPITQAFLPRVSFLHASDPRQARRFVARSLVGVGLLGAAMGVLLFAAAPLVVELLLGEGYAGAVPVLRALAALAPIVALSTVLGMHWAVPFGLERLVLRAVAAGAAVNLAAVWLLVPRFGAAGMCAAVVAADAVVLAGLGAEYVRRNA